MTPFAMVFPGQGSQTVGMLTTLAMDNPIIEITFREASHILDYDIWRLIQQGPEEMLNITSRTQPALLSASVAIYRLWRHKGGPIPTMMAGHSLGEYAALVCGGVINFHDAIKLVELRGKLMQEAMPDGTGAMQVIIGLNDAAIWQVCKEITEEGQVVSPVNFNSPGQVVIAGHKEAVERAGYACKAAGAKRTLSLPVSVPSHCSLMKSAAEKLEIALKSITFNVPILPIVNNVDVKCEHSPEAIRSALVRQLYNPVRWTEIVELMAEKGIGVLLEVGPGRVLTGLTKRIVNTLISSAINDPISLTSALKQ